MVKLDFKILRNYENKSKWRLNLLVTYRDISSAKTSRQLVLSTLLSVARLRRIYFGALTEFPIQDVFSDIPGIENERYPVDVVCFRSTKHTLSSISEVREIVSRLFQHYDVRWNNTMYDIRFLEQKYLKRIPFPECENLS